MALVLGWVISGVLQTRRSSRGRTLAATASTNAFTHGSASMVSEVCRVSLIAYELNYA